MYTKQEAAAIRQEFWTTLGKYLSPIPSATGQKVNWVNYKTGVKHIHFKMDADKDGAVIRIDMTGDGERRKRSYDLFTSLKKTTAKYFVNEFIWQEETEDIHGKIIACIYCSKEELNIFRREDWPALISFLKRI